MDPTVSVIIPTYNRAKFVQEAIVSLLDQTFSDFEAIVVDDGSVDDTEQVVCALSDPRIFYIRQENQGRSRARNCALKLARGRYIAFLDSDDLYLPTKLAIQVTYLEVRRNIGMVYTSAYCISCSGTLLSDQYIASVSGSIYKAIAFFSPVTITLPTVMVRRELILAAGCFDERMHRFEDTDMWRRLSKITQIDALSEFTCKLRTHHENNLESQNPDSIIASLDYYAKKILKEDSEQGLLTLRHGLAELYYYYGRAFLSIPKWKDKGASLLRTAYRYWPPIIGKYPLARLNALLSK